MQLESNIHNNDDVFSLLDRLSLSNAGRGVSISTSLSSPSASPSSPRELTFEDLDGLFPMLSPSSSSSSLSPRAQRAMKKKNSFPLNESSEKISEEAEKRAALRAAHLEKIHLIQLNRLGAQLTPSENKNNAAEDKGGC